MCICVGRQTGRSTGLRSTQARPVRRYTPTQAMATGGGRSKAPSTMTSPRPALASRDTNARQTIAADNNGLCVPTRPLPPHALVHLHTHMLLHIRARAAEAVVLRSLTHILFRDRPHCGPPSNPRPPLFPDTHTHIHPRARRWRCRDESPTRGQP